MIITGDYTEVTKEAIKASGMTQKAIAIKSGVTEWTVNRFAAGHFGSFSNQIAVIMACGFGSVKMTIETTLATTIMENLTL